MLSETLSLRGIVEQQVGFTNWYIWKQPLAFCLFFITGMAEIIV